MIRPVRFLYDRKYLFVIILSVSVPIAIALSKTKLTISELGDGEIVVPIWYYILLVLLMFLSNALFRMLYSLSFEVGIKQLFVRADYEKNVRRIRRTRKRKISFIKDIQEDFPDVSLHGLLFKDEEAIEARDFNRLKFVDARQRATGTFQDLVFQGCNFTAVEFGLSPNKASKLKNVVFEDCKLTGCSFRHCDISYNGEDDVFKNAEIRRCDFSHSVLSGVNFHLQHNSKWDAKLSFCLFWGAKLQASCLSLNLEREFNRYGMFVEDLTGETGREIKPRSVYWCEALRDLGTLSRYWKRPADGLWPWSKLCYAMRTDGGYLWARVWNRSAKR